MDSIDAKYAIEWMNAVVGIPHLENLTLPTECIKKELLPLLQRVQTLIELDLKNQTIIDDEVMSTIGSCLKNLRILKLIGSYRSND